MKKLIIVAGVFALVLAIGLPLYLGPDDIRGCSEPAGVGKCQPVDVIVAVSGGDTNARTDEAIRLYKAGWSDSLLFSGAAADKSGPSNAQAMMQRALNSGVPAEVIRTEEKSTTTAENAQNTAEMLRESGDKRILLVTSAYHQRRTSIEFMRALDHNATIVNHPVANDSQWVDWWWLTPYGWVLGIGEIIKIIIVSFASL